MSSLSWEPLLLLWSLLSVTGARAPGDGDKLCTVTLPALDSREPPPLPANARVLMDSYDYINLLPTSEESAVWQQVDLDDNNVPGRRTEWGQNGDIPCGQRVTACGFGEGPQNNWLITQYVSKRVGDVGDVLLSHVNVQVVFELSSCILAACKGAFRIYIYEASTENSVLARSTSNYVPVSRVAPGVGTHSIIQNQTREATLYMNDAEGFYVGIRDESTCITVHRILIFYHVCSGRTRDLMILPETVAPPNGGAIEVTAQCVEGASPLGGGEVRMSCNDEGVWTAISGSECSCDPGFRLSADRTSCTALCEAGEYYSVTFDECRACRGADGDKDLDCTTRCNGSEIMVSSAGTVRYSHNADEQHFYSIGTVATFTCEGSYELMGNSTRGCELGGWSDKNPICISDRPNNAVIWGIVILLLLLLAAAVGTGIGVVIYLRRSKHSNRTYLSTQIS